MKILIFGLFCLVVVTVCGGTQISTLCVHILSQKFRQINSFTKEQIWINLTKKEKNLRGSEFLVFPYCETYYTMFLTEQSWKKVTSVHKKRYFLLIVHQSQIFPLFSLGGSTVLHKNHTYYLYFAKFFIGGNGKTYDTNVSSSRNVGHLEQLQYSYSFRHLGSGLPSLFSLLR